MQLIRSFLLLALSGAVASAAVERKFEKTFTVNPGSSVKVEISGGAIESRVGEPGAVHLVLDQRFKSADTDAEADAILANYEVIAEQSGDKVVLSVHAKKKFGWSDSKLSVSARIVVPADAKLDLETSGGAIKVLGEMMSSVRCDTSGGGIKVDGGPGDFSERVFAAITKSNLDACVARYLKAENRFFFVQPQPPKAEGKPETKMMVELGGN